MTEPIEIIMVRHGDSDKLDAEGNRIDDNARVLSPTGIAEVTALAVHLAESGVDPAVVFVSTITRAAQTAEIIVSHLSNPLLVQSELIGESDFGTVPNSREGLLSIDYGYDTPAVLAAGGEPIDSVEKRVLSFLEMIQARQDSRVMVVSHGHTLSVMSQILQGLERTFENIQILKTADYSYFLVSSVPNGELLQAKTNVLKGKQTP
jgi:broad specificity phosphatase PhoE